MHGADRGFVTLAASRPHYLEFAVDLALSLREFNREPIALILADELRPRATRAQLAAFDHVVPLAPGFRRNLGKLDVARATPFARSLFVDADCLAIGDLAPVWERLASASFAVQGEFLDLAREREHHRRSTRTLMLRFGLDRYFKSNSGIMYFRKEAGMRMAEACLAIHRDGFRGRENHDEILLGIAAARFDVTAIGPPLPMPWDPGVVEVGDRRYQIVHFIAPLAPATMVWLLDAVRRRRAAAGLPPDASAPFWRHKVSPWSRRILRDRTTQLIAAAAIGLRRAWRNAAARGARLG